MGDDFDKSHFNLKNINYITYKQFWHNWFNVYDVIITTDFERLPGWSSATKSICMFHGAGPKMSYICNPYINNFNAIFSVGPTTYQTQINYVDKSVTVEKIGLAILDTLRSESPPRLPSSIHFSNNNPVMLYAPSWSDNPDNISLDNGILDALSQIRNYNIIIRPHPLLLSAEKCGGINWKDKLLSIQSDTIKLSYSSDHSVYELLPLIDVLLGDISSVVYEFLALDRPIILYMKDGILESYDAGEFLEPLLAATTRITKSEALPRLLNHINEEKSEIGKKRRALMNNTFFNMGDATSHAVTAILKHTSLRNSS